MIANLQCALDPTQLQAAWEKTSDDTTLAVALFVKGCGVIFGVFSGCMLTCNVISLGCHVNVKTHTLTAIMMSVLCLAISYDAIVTAHAVQQSRLVTRVGDNLVEEAQKLLRNRVDLQTRWAAVQWRTFTKDTFIAKHLVDLAINLHKAISSQLPQ